MTKINVIKDFIWNPSVCECECDRSCGIRQNLDHKSCKCRNKLISKLVEECSENIDENRIIHNVTLNDNKRIWNSCTIYIVLLAISFLIMIGISSVFIFIST